jgi:hypothetical protein
MLFAAHQPHYLPWLRYLHKIAAADVFVLLDDAQYTKNGWQNRTRIKGPQGPVLLTVPVHAHLGALIRDVRPGGDAWVRRHLGGLDACYGRAEPWRVRLGVFLEAARDAPLAVLNEITLGLLLDAFDIRTPVIRSSELEVGGRGSERLAAIGRVLGADAYLTGAHAVEAYLDPRPFAAAGIELAVQRWECPVYEQRFPQAGFVPDLSALDLLTNHPGRAREVLMSGGEVRRDPALAAHAGA